MSDTKISEAVAVAAGISQYGVLECNLLSGGLEQLQALDGEAKLYLHPQPAELAEPSGNSGELGEKQGVDSLLADVDERLKTARAMGYEDDIGVGIGLLKCIRSALAATGKQQGDALADFNECLTPALRVPETAAYRIAVLAAVQAATGKQQVGEVQGDARITMSEDDFTRMVEGEAGEHGEMLEDGGPFSGWCFSCEELLEFSRGIINAWGMERRAQEAALAARQPGAQLAVWCGPMLESNGRQNWTAMLYRKGGDIFREGSMQIERSEYPDRVRYEADRLRYLIGELAEEPDIMEYDANLHSGYVEPPEQGIDLGQVHAAVESLLEFADHHESCGDSDSYNNAEFQTCGCGLDSAREQIWDALDGQRDAAPGVGQ